MDHVCLGQASKEKKCIPGFHPHVLNRDSLQSGKAKFTLEVILHQVTAGDAGRRQCLCTVSVSVFSIELDDGTESELIIVVIDATQYFSIAVDSRIASEFSSVVDFSGVVYFSEVVHFSVFLQFRVVVTTFI